MAFGDLYGYKTNSRFVVASAESRERGIDNPEYVDETETPDVPDTLYVVDLVLHGFANGRRNNCPVTVGAGAFDEVPNNTVVRAAEIDDLLDGTEPGQTTGGVPDATYSGGSSDQATQGAIA